jgi:hypothetical protein
MKFVTKVLQATNEADFIVISMNQEFANWILDVSRAIKTLVASRPANPLLWSVFQDSTSRFLRTTYCQYTMLDQYTETINARQFACMDEAIQVPVEVSCTVETAIENDSESAGNEQGTTDIYGRVVQPPPRSPPQTRQEQVTRKLDIDVQRPYITISDDGIAWHVGTESFGRRALSSPRMSFALVEVAAGIRTLREVYPD